MLTRELHNKALVAAETATTDYINKYGEHDACGFAWVTAYVNGASKLGKSFTLSISAKEAGANAYVATVRAELPDVKIYSNSRMD